MKFSLRLLLIGLCSLVLSSCAPEDMPVVVTPDGDAIRVEVAITPEIRQLGLMNRTSLDEDAGMLFVFESEMLLAFWMKNTLIPLDIIYIDADANVVDIQTMVPCEADPCPSYPAAKPARYALEINAGKAAELDLSIGDHLTFSLPSYDQAQGR